MKTHARDRSRFCLRTKKEKHEEGEKGSGWKVGTPVPSIKTITAYVIGVVLLPCVNACIYSQVWLGTIYQFCWHDLHQHLFTKSPSNEAFQYVARGALDWGPFMEK